MKRVLLLVCLGLCGCASRKKLTIPPDKAGVIQEDEVPKIGEIRLILHDPGIEPRRVLRYALPKAETQRYVMESEGKITLAAQTSRPMNKARGVIELSTSSAKGGQKYEWILIELVALPSEGISGDTRSATQSSMNTLVGAKGEWVADSTGRSLQHRVEIPELADAEMTRSIYNWERTLHAMSAVFPTQALGVGAQWTTDEVVWHVESEISIRTKRNYKIISIKNNLVDLSIESELSGIPGAMKFPNKPHAIGALVSATGRNVMKFKVDLDRGLPQKGTLSAMLRMRIEIKGSAAAEAQTMIVQGNSEVGLWLASP